MKTPLRKGFEAGMEVAKKYAIPLTVGTVIVAIVGAIFKR